MNGPNVNEVLTVITQSQHLSTFQNLIATVLTNIVYFDFEFEKIIDSLQNLQITLEKVVKENLCNQYPQRCQNFVVTWDEVFPLLKALVFCTYPMFVSPEELEENEPVPDIFVNWIKNILEKRLTEGVFWKVNQELITHSSLPNSVEKTKKITATRKKWVDEFERQKSVGFSAYDACDSENIKGYDVKKVPITSSINTTVRPPLSVPPLPLSGPPPPKPNTPVISLITPPRPTQLQNPEDVIMISPSSSSTSPYFMLPQKQSQIDEKITNVQQVNQTNGERANTIQILEPGVFQTLFNNLFPQPRSPSPSAFQPITPNALQPSFARQPSFANQQPQESPVLSNRAQTPFFSPEPVQKINLNTLTEQNANVIQSAKQNSFTHLVNIAKIYKANEDMTYILLRNETNTRFAIIPAVMKNNNTLILSPAQPLERNITFVPILDQDLLDLFRITLDDQFIIDGQSQPQSLQQSPTKPFISSTATTTDKKKDDNDDENNCNFPSIIEKMSEDEKQKVYVGPSTIPHAGCGAFAKRDLQTGEILGKYSGEILTQEAFEKRYPPSAVREWKKIPDVDRFIRERAKWLKEMKHIFEDVENYSMEINDKYFTSSKPRPKEFSSEIKNFIQEKKPPRPAQDEQGKLIFPEYPPIYRNGKVAVPAPTGGYILTVNDEIVDAEDVNESNWPRFINSYSLQQGVYPNVRYTEDNGEIQVLRPIKAGEELFIDYGMDYWLDFPFIQT